MKAYCHECKEVKPAFWDECADANTGKPFEDLVCSDCHFIIATVEEREATP